MVPEVRIGSFVSDPCNTQSQCSALNHNFNAVAHHDYSVLTRRITYLVISLSTLYCCISFWAVLCLGAIVRATEDRNHTKTLYKPTFARDRVLPRGPARVINGVPADAGEYPFHAVLLRYNSFHCGGTLLNKWTVLTADHCINGPYALFLCF